MSRGAQLIERRVPLLCEATAKTAQTSFSATVRNISHGGVQLCAQGVDEALFSQGETLVITCLLPRAAQPIELRTTVAWVRQGIDHRGNDAIVLGATFDALEEAARAELDQFILGYFETVLVVDGDEATRRLVSHALEVHYDVLAAPTATAALRHFDEHEIAVLVAATALPDGDVKQLFAALQTRYPGARPVRMVVVDAHDSRALEELSPLHRVFYFLRRPVQTAELQNVVRGAVAHYWEQARPKPARDDSPSSVRFAKRVLDESRRLAAQGDPGTASRLVVDAVLDLVEADRAYCYVYDPISETLSTGGAGREGPQRNAIAGIAGYVARAGAAVVLEHADADSRFQRSIDDPEAAGGERLAAVPLISGDGRPLGVLLAVRNASRRRFDEQDQERLDTLARSFAPSFGQIALQHKIEEVFARQRRPQQAQGPFRQQALRHHQHQDYAAARPLRLSPRWVQHGYRLLLATTALALGFVLFGKMPEYAAGPAIVRIAGKTDLALPEPGVVRVIEVQPGQRIAAQQVLVRMDDAREQRELERISTEFELQLVKSLREPGDLAVRETLSRLRTQREYARGQLEARAVRAPHAGVVSDVRVRPGQSVAAGDTLVSLTGEKAEPRILAFLPGQYRPMLRPGQRVRLEMSGYRYAYAEVTLEDVADEVIGPQEARRYVGKEQGDALDLRGSVVLVGASLPGRSFTADGKLYNYHEGMQALAEVRVRRQRIVARLIPALKALPWFSSFWSEAFDE